MLFFHNVLTASSNSRISIPVICSAVILAGGGFISSLAGTVTGEAGIFQPACWAYAGVLSPYIVTDALITDGLSNTMLFFECGGEETHRKRLSDKLEILRHGMLLSDGGTRA